MNTKIKRIVKILQYKSHLLNYRTITRLYNLSNENHVLKSNINSILSRNIRKNGKNSIFFRAAPGVYGLRGWLSEKENQYNEYLVERKKHDYLNESIVVIKSNDLQKLIQLPGVTKTSINSDLISSISIKLDRRKAEKSLDYIQLVSVFVLLHNKKILSFQRTKALPEERLRNTISINFGGHISFNDAYSAVYKPFDITDNNSLITRELHEEVLIKKKYKAKPVGFIYDNTSVLGKQHLGIFHIIELSSNEVKISEKKFFMNLSFKKINELYEAYELDFWSSSILEYTNKYLQINHDK